MMLCRWGYTKLFMSHQKLCMHHLQSDDKKVLGTAYIVKQHGGGNTVFNQVTSKALFLFMLFF